MEKFLPEKAGCVIPEICGRKRFNKAKKRQRDVGGERAFCVNANNSTSSYRWVKIKDGNSWEKINK